MAVDLAAYFRRIGFTGEAKPDLPTLRALHALHPVAIPFENLDPLLGRPVRLDLESLQSKLVGQRRGGYCFEQNALLRAVLEAIGFAVTPLAGRVQWMRGPGDPETPRTHMLLLVDLPEGKFIADVGFGGYLLAAPLALERDIEQGALRLTGAGDDWLLQASLGEGRRNAYRFTLERQEQVDYELGNWFTATHPASPFPANLMAQRLTREGHVNLLNRRLTHRPRGVPPTERQLRDAGELEEVLATVFGIEPPAPSVDIWARLQAG